MNPTLRRGDDNGRRQPKPRRQTAKPSKNKASINKRQSPVLKTLIKDTKKTQLTPPTGPQRINKYLADQGLVSRREADELITAKLILINNRPAKLGDQVTVTDQITLLGSRKAKSYLAYYKGRGIITHSPSEKEVDIATRLRQDYGIKDLTPVGRLDKDSEGLIILSNDGRITGPLLDSDLNHEKEYLVTVDKDVTPVFVKLMELGVNIEGYTTKPSVVVASPKNSQRFNITLTEGKKHQIRRMCAALGYQIKSLKRVRIMNITLGTLKPNQYRKITGPELNEFLKALGVER